VTRPTLRLRVDPVACDAHGYCAELLPELIGTDEWGYPILDRAAIPPALLRLAQRAVRDCPRRALRLERVDDRSVPSRVGSP
jgi:ferredoxin